MAYGRVIGIDGGGTKTEFVLAGADGTVLDRVVLGASNPFDVGMERCEAVLTEGLSALGILDAYGQCGADTVEREGTSDRAGVDALYAGLAGGISGDSQGKITAILERLLPGLPKAAGSDMLNAISSGSLDGTGCAVIAGTGSSCFARGKNGLLVRVGGWGYLLDGAGSGYDLGAGALGHTLRVLDGRAAESPLSRLTILGLGGSPADKLSEIYAGGKRFIASLAPQVFAAADAHDPMACDLIEQTAAHIGELANTACDRAGLEQCAVVCIGGLWKRRDLLEPLVLAHLREGLTLQYPTVPPVFGACAEAVRIAGGTVTEGFRKQFEKTMEA